MSLLAALKNKTQPLATAIPAIPATRRGESEGGIAGIAGIAIAAGQTEKDKSTSEQAANDAPRPTPGLLEVIRRMAAFYEYEPDELDYALSDAKKNPDTWRELIRNDRHAAMFINPLPEHQLEAVEIWAKPSVSRAVGDPLTLAFHAACAFEDAERNAPTPFIGRADTLLRNAR